MTLPNLTSPGAVREAIREADTIGSDSFLAKYGYRPARTYFLEFDGKLYDSKAIVGAAHGYEQRCASRAVVRAYCYNAAAENTYLRRLGLAGGILEDVTAFIRSDQWVDILQVVDRPLLTGGGLGLKKIAPLTGFAWSVDDPGGGGSMLRHDVAVKGGDDGGRDAARHWLLDYNRGDVEATLAIRDWLDDKGASIPSVESLEALFRSSSSDQQAGEALR